MAHGCNHKQVSEGKQVEQCLTYASEQVEKVYGGINSAMSVAKKSASFFSRKGNATRSLSLQQTAVLKRPCLISHGETINVQFEIGEKLTIMFMYNNKYAVYRESDGTIAVLSNAEFQGTPPAMLDGSKFGALLKGVELLLMYAVGKVEHCDVGGLRFSRNDVILILAHCKGTFVGITPRKRVGLFPSELVQPITKRRLCIFKGMVLKMNALIDCNTKKVYEGLMQEITKSSEGLFSWLTIGGEIISLHLLIEKSTPESPEDVFKHPFEEVDGSLSGGLHRDALQKENTRPLPHPPENKFQSDEHLEENEEDSDDEHHYIEIDNFDQYEDSLSDMMQEVETVESPTERRNLYLPSDQRKQGRQPRPKIGSLKGQAVFAQICQKKKHISDLKYHLQSITISQTCDIFRSLDAEENEVQKRKLLLDTLQPFRQMEVNDQIFNAVAGYLEAELFHEVGKKLGVHISVRCQIQESETDVVVRTIDLLDQWHKKEGKQATLGKLIDALSEFDPGDMLFILEELCEEVTTYSDVSY